jgi:glyoxylase-like metal-dependent hydrolase (beta-lactamase superfamily II)
MQMAAHPQQAMTGSDKGGGTMETFSVGGIDCWILSDGHGAYELDSLFGNVPLEEIRPLLESDLDEEGLFPLPYRCLLIRSADQFALVDAGLGEIAEQVGWPAGKLSETMGASGFAPEEIGTIIVSHCHPDHIGGLTRQEGDHRAPVYGRATHVFWEAEWQFWTSKKALSELPDEMAGPARVTLPPLEQAGLVETITEERQILPGVTAIPAPGHTPGHMAVAITSGGEGALYLGDSVMHGLNFEHTDWLSPLDAIPNLTIESRRRLLERAVNEQWTVVAFHLSGRGRVSRSQREYRWDPA